MIVVEGPDGSGKTTLINHLILDCGVKLAPRGWLKNSYEGPKENLFHWTTGDLGFEYPIPPKQGLLYDRYPLISELIYGSIIRGRPQKGFDNLTSLLVVLTELIAYKPIIIICLPPLEVAASHIRESTQSHMKGVGEHFEQIYWAYHMLAAWMTTLYPRTYIWDYTKDSATVDYEDIVFWVKKERKDVHGRK